MTNLLAEPAQPGLPARPPTPDEIVPRRGHLLRASTAVGTAGNRLLATLARPAWQRAAAGAGLAAVLVMSVAAVVVGPLPENRPQPWWFNLPGAWPESPAGVVALSVAFYAGLGLLTVAWLVVGIGVRAGRWRVRGLCLLGGIWAAPLVLAPVALSTDLYTYLGQGLVAHTGLNPYQYGPVFAGLPAGVVARMAVMWLGTPSPYGPVFVGLAGAIAPLAREHLVYALVILRLVAVAGLVLLAFALPRLARRLGADPARATWLGVTSPLVLGSFVLSGHNDALMLGLLVAGLAMAARERPVAGVSPALVGVALCALAAMVKAPAAAAIVFLAVAWAWQQSTLAAGAVRLAASALVAAAVAAATTLVVGVGWGWFDLAALMSPALTTTPFTPVSSIAFAVSWVAGAFGGAVPFLAILPTFQTAGLAAALAFGLALLARHRRVGVARALGLTLLAVVLASPVTWPWYLSWGVVLLAAATPARRVRGLIGLAAVPLLVIRPDGGALEFGPVATLLVAAASLVLVLYTVRWSYRNLVRPAGAR